jgi:4-alpha-glucanotransferase
VADPEAWGILPGHHHVRGDWVPAPERGVAAALRGMRADGPAPPPTPTWVVRRRDGLSVPGEATLHTEDGGSVAVPGRLPPEALPLGYHRLVLRDREVALIVSPGACPLPPRMWGWASQLYATRSRSSWGIGDLADLRRLRSWAARLGAGMVLVNPLHAVAPTPDPQASPYFPTSRRWLNPVYLRIEDVPGAAGLPPELAAAGRALNADRRIDRAAVWRLKRSALTEIWQRGVDDRRFDRWCEGQGDGLAGFATWCALADAFGPDWRRWDPRFRRPDAPAVSAFAGEQADAVRFHRWLQWLCAEQLGGDGAAVVSDVAIGADPAGADAWLWQDVLAEGVTVGAPPDEFSPGGQDWGLPPFDPWRLQAAGYRPFAEVARAGMQAGGGVRIDHVAGLFRLFWVPAEGGAAEGVYVRYPWQDLLNVLSLEAARAGAFVIGEDLGTVEDSTRQALAQWGVLSYRLVWFEDRPPAEWPELALAAVTTHDLPTVCGLWTGADAEHRRAAGLTVDADADGRVRERLIAVCGVDEAPTDDIVRRAHAAVAASPCRLAVATLDDALRVDERPNMPGTVDEWPNWSIALPLPLEELESDPGVLGVAEVMRAPGRG